MTSAKVTLERPLQQPPPLTLIRRHVEMHLRKATAPWRALPDFVIAGAQKSGTSSLHHYLVQHPQLLPAAIKEVHYFNGGLDPRWDKYAEGPRLYRSYFPLRMTVQQRRALCFESTPDYLFNPVAAARMAALLPDARYIVLLRDPVERAISHYFHELRRGRETADIETAFAQEAARLASALATGNFKDPRFINLSYVARGMYAEQLERLFAHIDRDRVLVLEAEALFETPVQTLRRVLDFIGIGDFPQSVDIRPTGLSDNKTDIPARLRAGLQDRFAAPNQRLAALLGEKFRWM